MRQLVIMVGSLMLLTVVLIFTALAIYNHEPKEVDPDDAKRSPRRWRRWAASTPATPVAPRCRPPPKRRPRPPLSQVAYGGTTDGKAIFDHLCTSCHTAGVAGAPKVGNKAMWAPRIAQGMDTLFKHATEGYHGPDGNYMPPKGGNPALTEAQIKAAVTWMVGQSK